MVSENEGTASPGLAAAVAQMPFATALGVVADGAGRRVAQVTQVQAVLGGGRGR